MKAARPAKAKAPSCYDGLQGALDLLEHYHTQHVSDDVSLFYGRNHQCDIYVVSDPECREKFKALLLAETYSSDTVQ